MGCFAVVWGHPQVWRVLWASCGVCELLKGLLHVAGHVQVNSVVLIVPFQVDSQNCLASQSMVMVYLDCSVSMRWSACSLPTYLMQKSSTTRQKEIGQDSWVKRPGMVADWL